MIPPSESEAALLGMALGKPIAGREAWLQAVCGEDHPLQQRLDALLGAYGETPGPRDETVGQIPGR